MFTQFSLIINFHTAQNFINNTQSIVYVITHRQAKIVELYSNVKNTLITTYLLFTQYVCPLAITYSLNVTFVGTLVD